MKNIHLGIFNTTCHHIIRLADQTVESPNFYLLQKHRFGPFVPSRFLPSHYNTRKLPTLTFKISRFFLPLFIHNLTLTKRRAYLDRFICSAGQLYCNWPTVFTWICRESELNLQQYGDEERSSGERSMLVGVYSWRHRCLEL